MRTWKYGELLSTRSSYHLSGCGSVPLLKFKKFGGTVLGPRLLRSLHQPGDGAVFQVMYLELQVLEKLKLDSFAA